MNAVAPDAESPLVWLKRRLSDACEELAVTGDEPLVLDDWRHAYVTLADQHDLYSVGYQDGRPVGRREHVARCPAGQLLFGVAPAPGPAPSVLLLSGLPGSVVWRVPLALLAKLVREEPPALASVSALVDSWYQLLIGSLPESAVPAEARAVAPGDVLLPLTGPVRAARGLCWILPARPPALYRGLAVGDLEAPVPWWAVSPSTAAVCTGSGLQVASTAALLVADPSGSLMRGFAAFTVAAMCRRRGELARNRMRCDLASVQAEAELLDVSLRELARVGRGQRRASMAMALPGQLQGVVAKIHHHLGMTAPLLDAPPAGELSALGSALERSTGARSRPVVLEGEWWRASGPPLLGFVTPDGEAPGPLYPVALLPRGSGYVVHDPAEPGGGEAPELPVTAALAARLAPQAYQFYRRLPAGGGRRGLTRFLVTGARRDALVALAVGLLVGLLGLSVPLLTGLVFDRIVPGAERSLLAQLVLLLLAAYLGSGLFDVAQGLALTRLHTRAHLEAESAIWDHLLRLPLRFFRAFTAGELADRVQGIARMREVLVGAALASLLGGVFAFWNAGLLWALDARLAPVALGLVAVAALAATLAGAFTLVGQRRIAAADGRLGGLLFQLMSGINKLRVARAERRAFGVWANLVADRRSAEVGVEIVQSRHQVFRVVYPVICSAILFYLLAGRGGATGAAAAPATAPASALSTGQFLAFYAAFSTLLSAALAMTAALLEVLAAVPLFERIRPVLAEPAEDVTAGAPARLAGNVELSHVSFRYHRDAPLVLDDVSLRLEPGEFVAVVGASGSGKSTLLRLLLGLEAPTSGDLYYDGQSLGRLDVRTVRQQIGVVLQGSDVMAGSIYSNIAGSSGASVDEAWEAARLAALDKDIAAMPMGMHTVLTQGRSTLSGGQKQRLLIARALVRRPRLLFFDEATSALDNQTQALVSDSVARLNVTRLVIAHRLSTIEQADRVLVMDRGRIVEQGSFWSLMSGRTALRALADRQAL